MSELGKYRISRLTIQADNRQVNRNNSSNTNWVRKIKYFIVKEEIFIEKEKQQLWEWKTNKILWQGVQIPVIFLTPELSWAEQTIKTTNYWWPVYKLSDQQHNKTSTNISLCLYTAVQNICNGQSGWYAGYIKQSISRQIKRTLWRSYFVRLYSEYRNTNIFRTIITRL